MKRLLTIIGLLLTLLCAPSWATVTLVQTVTGTTGGGPGNLVITISASGAGDTLIVAGCLSSSTVSDNKSSTYTVIDTGGTGRLWVADNVASGVTAVTITNTTVPMAGLVREYSGLKTSSLDVHTVNSTTGTNPTSGASSATTETPELVIGVFIAGGSGTPTLGSGFANLTTVNSLSFGVAIEDMTANTIAAQTANFNMASSTYSCYVAALKTVGGSAPATAGSLLLLGVGK